jgi:hypothetical protein
VPALVDVVFACNSDALFEPFDRAFGVLDTVESSVLPPPSVGVDRAELDDAAPDLSCATLVGPVAARGVSKSMGRSSLKVDKVERPGVRPEVVETAGVFGEVDPTAVVLAAGKAAVPRTSPREPSISRRCAWISWVKTGMGWR